MVMYMEDIHELFQKLPDDLKREVLDYIEFLIERHGVRKSGGIKLTWKGKLKELRNKYTSVELQHKALDWWG